VAGDAGAQLDRMRTRLTWSERIRDALDKDGFALVEQPILGLAGARVERSEVLVRLRDGDRLTPPSVFLPVAERFGQIQAIDRWVIRGAIALLAERQEHGVRLGLEVNLSGLSISDRAVVDFIAAEVRNAGIDPTALTFEVTETAAIENISRVRALARTLSDLGCQFALDDFGSGFGSFYYLKHLPFDVVKIDGDFIKELPRNRTDQLTVQAIVQIARGLGNATVAEFVQDDDTLGLLREYGVDYAQGYHVGRPRRATEGRRPAPLSFRV
jgi:EAL domain-containing protein (putative c-di-GMP-specific phosphodiesterase class I)